MESLYLVKISKCILIACHIDSHSHLWNNGGEKTNLFAICCEIHSELLLKVRELGTTFSFISPYSRTKS